MQLNKSNGAASAARRSIRFSIRALMYVKDGQIIVKGITHPVPNVYIGKANPVLLTFAAGQTATIDRKSVV